MLVNASLLAFFSMSQNRLERTRIWLGRLLLVTLVLAAGLMAWGVQEGSVTKGRALRAWGRLTGVSRPQVALVAGHRGYDTGAVCQDGLMEVSITEEVAKRVAKLLQQRGVWVEVLDEYDRELEGLSVAALLSIHVDSCIDMTGFKVATASETVLAAEDSRLGKCVEAAYALATGLPIHPNTITHDMTGYHAFQRVADDTPGAIIELGFLGGDRETLTNRQDAMAQGIYEGLMCFLDPTKQQETPTPGGQTGAETMTPTTAESASP